MFKLLRLDERLIHGKWHLPGQIHCQRIVF